MRFLQPRTPRPFARERLPHRRRHPRPSARLPGHHAVAAVAGIPFPYLTMSIRSNALLGALALATFAPVVGAQRDVSLRRDGGQFAGVRFGAASQQLLDITAVAAPAAVAGASGNDADPLAEAMPSDSWGGVRLHATDDDASQASRSGEPGFWGSSNGRLAMLSLAGLAGAGYYASSSDGTAATAAAPASLVSASPTAGPTGFAAPAPGGERNTIALVIETPEPATTALMAVGLAALGVVARRRLAR